MLKPVSKESLQERCCAECREPLIGRSDKKFCDDACRTAYNNRSKSDETGFVRNINNLLRRNRRILKYFHELGEARVGRQSLSEMGFLFSYLTNTRSNGGETYHYVYEFGYLELPGDSLLIVKSKS